MGLEQSEPTGDIEGIDTDALLEDVDKSTNKEIPMTPPPPDPEEVEKAAKAQEYELTVNGQVIKAPIDKIKQWAQQGYDYPQKMAELNRRQALIDNLEKQYGSYKLVDEYAKNNPQWWQTIQSQFESLQNPQQPQPGSDINPLIHEKLQELEKFKNEVIQQKEIELREKQDSALNNEIQSIRKQYGNLDWGSLDENGYSLEQRVMKYAIDNNISSFRAAFRDYNYDDIVRLEQERAKETLAKETQKRTKLGLLGSSPTPSKGLTEAQGLKGKSYNDILRETIDELGIS